MQTLIFNTTTKRVQLLSGTRGDSKVLETFENVSTVKYEDYGFYEVMQKIDENSKSSIPVMRVPISNTNMLIRFCKPLVGKFPTFTSRYELFQVLINFFLKQFLFGTFWTKFTVTVLSPECTSLK